MLIPSASMSSWTRSISGASGREAIRGPDGGRETIREPGRREKLHGLCRVVGSIAAKGGAAGVLVGGEWPAAGGQAARLGLAGVAELLVPGVVIGWHGEAVVRAGAAT